jgi:hypothetical protein
MVVDDRRGRGRGAAGIGVGGFVLALLTVGALLHVGVRMKGIEVAYALGKERKLNTELEERRRQLHIEIGMLKDPGRVVGLARDKLKMGPPPAGAILHGLPFEPAAPPPAAIVSRALLSRVSVSRASVARAPLRGAQ